MKEIVHNPKQKLSPKPTLAGRRQLSNDEAITLISTRLRDDVIGAGTAYGVEPRLVAAILMNEASLYNVWDRLQDLVAWWIIQLDNHRALPASASIRAIRSVDMFPPKCLTLTVH